MDTLLTPSKIKNVTFEKERNGYDRANVDAFLEDVCETVAAHAEAADRADAELAALRADLASALADAQQLREKLEAAPVVPGAQSPEHGAVGLLSLAQQTADLAIADAHAKATGLVNAAEARAEELLSAAAQAADDLRNDAAADADAQRQAAADETAAALARVSSLREAEATLRGGVLALVDALRDSLAGGQDTDEPDTDEPDTEPDTDENADGSRPGEDAQVPQAQGAEYDVEAALAALAGDTDIEGDGGYGQEQAPQYG